MLKNYFIVAVRNIVRNRVYSFINILGLSVGLATAILMLQYAIYEWNFDKFNHNYDDIYRVKTEYYQNNVRTNELALSYTSTGELLQRNVPGVTDFARLRPTDNIVSYEDTRFHEGNMYYADDSFLRIFDFPFVKGTGNSALSEPNAMVISEMIAEKYFKDQDPIDKIMLLNNKEAYVVKGVFKNVPDNSHLKFNFLLSIKSFLTSQLQQFESKQPNMFTYILVQPNADIDKIEGGLSAFVSKYYQEQKAQQGTDVRFALQPLKKIHLYSNLEFEAQANGDGTALYFLLLLSLFILFVVWINYISLATVSSMKRSKEVGVRLVMGSSRLQLVRQFLSESVLINGFAAVLAIGIAIYGSFFLRNYAELNIPLLSLQFPELWIAFLALLLLGTFLSGSYPALVLSSFKPIAALRAGFAGLTSKSNSVRKTLVIIQFTFSTLLITGTVIIYQQINFMKNKDIGINIDNVVVIPLPPFVDANAVEVFKNEVKTIHTVKNASASSLIPGRGYNAEKDIRREDAKDETNSVLTRIIGADKDFLKTFQVKLIAGRDFSDDYLTDNQTIILNEEAQKLLNINFSESAKVKVVVYDMPWEVIGIVKNFNQKSVKESVDPIVFFNWPTPQYCSIKLDGPGNASLVTQIEKTWKARFPNQPFDYFFLDDFYNTQYKSDQRFINLFKLFAGLSIIISSLGLFGLNSFRVFQKSKELAIRKVLGANFFQITYILIRDSIQPVILGNMISIPLTYYLMTVWLSEFPSRISIQWTWFVFSMCIVLITALLVIGYHTVKAAFVNPVNSLRID